MAPWAETFCDIVRPVNLVMHSEMWASCLVCCCVWQEKQNSYIVYITLFLHLHPLNTLRFASSFFSTPPSRTKGQHKGTQQYTARREWGITTLGSCSQKTSLYADAHINGRPELTDDLHSWNPVVFDTEYMLYRNHLHNIFCYIYLDHLPTQDTYT
jgi:hypothetical protein